MKKQEAEQFPLFKDYEFGVHFGGRGGARYFISS